MSKFAKITLLTLAAFLLLGFSITVNAAKPAQGQEMMSAPIEHNGFFTCMATNLSDRQIDVTFRYIGQDGFNYGKGCTSCNQFLPVTIDSGDTGHTSWVPPGSFPGNINAAHCVINWEGKPNDVRASFCVLKFTAELASFSFCYELS